MAKIDDAHIKNLISEYQQTGNGVSQIIKLISEYIYNYPKIRFNQTEDVCSDFYIYFFQRLPPTLMKYQVQDCHFTSWLVVVLRRHYINWAKKNQKASNKSVHYLDDFTYQGKLHTEHDVNLSASKEIQSETIRKILNSLPKKVRIVMKLHYFDFFEGDDLIDISQIFKRDLSLLIEKYNTILSHVLSQYEQENLYFDKLNSAFSQFSHYKEKLNSLGNEVLQSERENLLKKINQYKEQHQKMLIKMARFHVSVKNEIMGDFLGIKANAIHNLIFRGKALLREKLLDEKLC